MKKPTQTLLAALAATSMLFAAGTASAHGNGWGHDRGRHEWRDDDRGHWRHHRHHRPEREVVVRERVIIREQPIYRHYEERYPVYAEPGVVIGVSIPPIVIPFR